MGRLEAHRGAVARTVLVASVLSLALVLTPDASADGDLDRLEAIWNAGDYPRATRELIAYRERTGTRTPEIDYMIATSACRTSDRRALGNEFFGWILQNYNLSPANRTQVESQRQACSAGAAPERLPATAPAAMVGVAYHGKGGTGYDSMPAGNRGSTVVAPIPPEQLAKRLFAPADAQKAVLAVARLLGPDFEVQAVGHFVLAGPRSVAGPSPGILNAAARPLPRADAGTPPNAPSINPEDLLSNRPPNLNPPLPPSKGAPPQARQDPRDMVQQMAPVLPAAGTNTADLRRVGESLEDYVRFYVSEYGMRPPPYLITVYFAADRQQLYDLARKLHGIELPPGSIGYSAQADQSMVAWADGKTYGTFAHELFHVMVRNNFGDIPPFLDEGMAALYEVSGFQGRRAVGVSNWRGAILKSGWTERPRLKDMVQMNRSAFDDMAAASDPAAPGDKQGVNHATARYLMLYLQERGELVAVYRAFRNRKVSDRPAEQGVSLMEAALGRPLDTVDVDFASWFKTLSP